MRFIVDTQAAKLVSSLAASMKVEDVVLEQNQILVSTSQDLCDNLTGPQLKDLHNNVAKERGLKERRSEFANKAIGSGKVFELFFNDASVEEEQKKEADGKKEQAKAARSPKKKTKTAASKKPAEKKERKVRERKPDTKFVKLVKMFFENPGVHFNRADIEKKTGYKETSLIVRISKIRTNFLEKGKDKSQGGPEQHIGMAIVKHRATQTWSYEPEGNEALQFDESVVLKMLADLESAEKAEAESSDK